MNLSIESVADIDEVAYMVHADRQRLLTVVTDSDLVLIKWLKEAKKCINNTKQRNTTVVALTAETHNASTPPDPDRPYDLLVLSLGSSCILYEVPERYQYVYKPPIHTPKLLKEFLSNKKVMVVGVGIKSVAEKLHRIHDITVANAVDLLEMAKKHDIVDKDLNGLATSVLGNNKHIERSRKKLQWYGRDFKLREEKVMYAAAESHQTFQIAATLIQTPKKKRDLTVAHSQVV